MGCNCGRKQARPAGMGRPGTGGTPSVASTKPAGSGSSSSSATPAARTAAATGQRQSFRLVTSGGRVESFTGSPLEAAARAVRIGARVEPA